MDKQRVQIHSFVTPAPDGCEWSASCPNCFTPEAKTHSTPLHRWLGGFQSWPGRFGEDKNVLALLEIKLQFLSCPA